MEEISVKHVGEQVFPFHTGKSLKETVGLVALTLSDEVIQSSHISTASSEPSNEIPSRLIHKHSVGQKHRLLALKVQFCTEAQNDAHKHAQFVRTGLSEYPGSVWTNQKPVSDDWLM